MTTINPQDEIDEVRANCGGAGESNLPEADIDSALSMADEETTERTGMLPSDLRLPHLRRKMKLLIATAYLMVRFTDMKDVRFSIVRELELLTNAMKVLESTDEDDESIIDSDPTVTADAQQINYWTRGKKRSLITSRFRAGYNADDYATIRQGWATY
jgi:hypothetical protein